MVLSPDGGDSRRSRCRTRFHVYTEEVYSAGTNDREELDRGSISGDKAESSRLSKTVRRTRTIGTGRGGSREDYVHIVLDETSEVVSKTWFLTGSVLWLVFQVAANDTDTVIASMSRSVHRFETRKESTADQWTYYLW